MQHVQAQPTHMIKATALIFLIGLGYLLQTQSIDHQSMIEAVGPLVDRG